MSTNYSAEQNVQILIALMKAHGVKKVVASPGATNVCFVASICNDPYFEIYSAVDERSAAYMACGLAAETGGGGSVELYAGNSVPKLFSGSDGGLLS